MAAAWVGRGSARVRAALGAAFTLAMIAAACGDASRLQGCDGVLVGGQCQKKCDPAACVEAGMKCVNNACSQPCVTHQDCPAGKYCYSTRTDDGVEGHYCDYAPFALHDGGTGQYEPCVSDADCDTLRGYVCAAGECKLACKQNLDCAGLPGSCTKSPTGGTCDKGPARIGPYEPCSQTTECDEDQGLGCVDGECRLLHCKTHSDCSAIGLCSEGTNDLGQKVLACTKHTTYPPGQFGTPCPGGPNQEECDGAHGFVCEGAGAGDLGAYCTKLGCSSDTDCADGYRCALVRTTQAPCSPSCGQQGSSANACIAAEEIGPGKPYSCGNIGLVKHICLAREYCAPCTSDEDCRARPGQVCADAGNGEKICTLLCDPKAETPCPWGTASKCAVFDSKLGKATCAHRFGSCSGSGKSCEPCLDESDCPTGFCATAPYTGEHYCADLSVSCDCTGQTISDDISCSGGGCPKTPGGATMTCYGGSAVTSSVLFDKCLGANLSAPGNTPKGGCWPPG